MSSFNPISNLKQEEKDEFYDDNSSQAGGNK